MEEESDDLEKLYARVSGLDVGGSAESKK